MGMVARKTSEHESVRGKLEQVIREALKPALKAGTSLEEIVEAVADAMRGKLILGIRRPKERKTTRRALSLRLPEVGVVFPYEHNGKRYLVSVVEDGVMEVEVNGVMERYKSLKAVAFAILGYSPPIGGWRFFFGGMSWDEVNTRYGKP